MKEKLRDALDDIQSQIDSGYLFDKTSYEELRVILEAAWAYWDLLD